MKNNILYILSLLLICSSCHKDDIVDTNINPPPTPTISYEIDVIGIVVDTEGDVLSDVHIDVAGQSTTTDNNGQFRIKKLEVDGVKGSYIGASAEGYFEGGNRLYTQGVHDRSVKITLIEKDLSGYVNATKQGSVQTDSGMEITFPANGFTFNGADYDGLVSVYAYHLDPSESNFLDRSPGDLSGTDEQGGDFLLTSYGMLAVEMETPDGQEVQIKEGMKATISVPVDLSLLSNAPSTIPLWHFDDVLNKWMKEGEAQLINGKYVGEVAHFSWWNCDDFTQAATLCVQVFDGRYQGSLQGLIVELTSSTAGTSTAETDSEGFVFGQIPANEALEVTIYDQCGEVVYTGTLGPYTGDDNKEIIPVMLNNVEIYPFSGMVFDCESMSPLSDAVIKVYIEDNEYYFATDENGAYSFSLLVCGVDVAYTISAFSPTAGMAGAESGTVSTTQTNVLDVNLCNETSFLILTDDMGEVIVSEVEIKAHIKPNETIVFSDVSTILLGFSGNSIGTFPASFVDGQIYVSNTSGTVTITQFDDGIGGIIKGSIHLTIPSSGDILSGSFVAEILQ